MLTFFSAPYLVIDKHLTDDLRSTSAQEGPNTRWEFLLVALDNDILGQNCSDWIVFGPRWLLFDIVHASVF